MRPPAFLLLLFALLTGCTSTRPTRVLPSASPPGVISVHPSGTFFVEQGMASWYGSEFHHLPTASGEIYDMYAMTAAHRTLPLGTCVTVTDLETLRTVKVRINDRGPFVEGRIIDLSFAAASKLGSADRGLAHVEIRCPFTSELLREKLGYWVQVGAYEDKGNAEDLLAGLEHRFPDARILTAGNLHRVRIGCFPGETEAREACDAFRAQGMHAFVVRDLVPLSPTGATIHAAQEEDCEDPTETITPTQP